MDFYSFAPIAALLHLASQAVTAIATFLTPFTGSLAMALAIIMMTLLVRAALIPIGAAQMRAETTRKRIAPHIKELQKRYKKSPEKLQKAMVELYAKEKTSPFAGMLPTLAQAPVLSVIYGLFIVTVINGQPNALLNETLFGVPLGKSLVIAAQTGLLWPELAVYVALLALIALTAWGSRASMLAQQTLVDESQPAGMVGLGRALSWMPFLTVLFAAIVPLAATLYLTVTTAWTLCERALLRRRAARSSTPA